MIEERQADLVSQLDAKSLHRRNSADIPYISEIPTAWNFDHSPVISGPWNRPQNIC